MPSSLAVSSGSSDAAAAMTNTSSPNNTNRRNSSYVTTKINIETIRLHVSSTAARLRSRVSLNTLRPLNMFLGISSNGTIAGAFTSPIRKIDKSSWEKIKSRVGLNLAFFLTNYVLIASMVALVVALMHPGMIFFVAIVCGLWSFHTFLIRNQLDFFGIHVHSLLSIQQRFYLLFTVTTVVVVWKCLLPSLIFAIISTLLICFHAFMRDPKHIETMDLTADDAGGGGGGGGNSSDDEDNDNKSHGSEVMVETPLLSRTGGGGSGGNGNGGDII